MFKQMVKYFYILFLIGIITLLITNLIVIITTINNITTEKEVAALEDVDCILILGAGIRGNTPSPMLEDRLLKGMSLYKNKVSKKILVSGDHTDKYYDEVNVMKNYLVGYKIPSQDIFMDHAGISTYDSIYRAKYIFNAEKIIIVTQKYHLYRAIYIAKKLNIEVYGIESNPRTYTNQTVREIREILARTKDYFKALFSLESTYLGEQIPITGNGDITNDY